MIDINKWKNIALLSSLCITSCAVAKTTYHCPEKVQLNNATLLNGTVPQTWENLTTNSPLWLTNIAIYDGPVSENASLIPSEENTNTSKWIFEGEFKRGKFISCEYGNGVIKLSTEIEKKTSSCTATTKPTIKRIGIDADFSCGS